MAMVEVLVRRRRTSRRGSSTAPEVVVAAAAAAAALLRLGRGTAKSETPEWVADRHRRGPQGAAEETSMVVTLLLQAVMERPPLHHRLRAAKAMAATTTRAMVPLPVPMGLRVECRRHPRECRVITQVLQVRRRRLRAMPLHRYGNLFVIIEQGSDKFQPPSDVPPPPPPGM
jgi:hypothetical protein